MKKVAVVKAVDEALAKVEALIANSKGEDSSCRVFDSMMLDEKFTERQREAVRLYVQSWIEHPLQLALVAATESPAANMFSYEEAVRYLRSASRFGVGLDEAENPCDFVREVC